MAYTKVTLDVLKEKLKNKEYATPTAARRALGRVDMTGADKDRARDSINKHFGMTEKAPAKKAASKKAPAKAPKKTPAKKATAKKAPAKKAT
jgi:hypothetical protein